MMNMYAKRGDKVIFTGNHGYESERESAKKILTVGEVYEVESTNVYSFSSTVELVGHKGFFNTVMFDNVSKTDEVKK